MTDEVKKPIHPCAKNLAKEPTHTQDIFLKKRDPDLWLRPNQIILFFTSGASPVSLNGFYQTSLDLNEPEVGWMTYCLQHSTVHVCGLRPQPVHLELFRPRLN